MNSWFPKVILLITVVASSSCWPIIMSRAGSTTVGMMDGVALALPQRKSFVWPESCFGGYSMLLPKKWEKTENLKFKPSDHSINFSKRMFNYFNKLEKNVSVLFLCTKLNCTIKMLVFLSRPQSYDPDLFKLALGCLSAVAGAIPPDHLDPSCTGGRERHSTMDSERRFCPRPLDTLK